MIIKIIFISFLLVSFIGFVVMLIKFTDERNKNLYLHGKFNPFESKGRFLTPNEKHTFEKLQELGVFKSFYILPQLHLSTFLKVKDNANDLAGKFDWINKLFVDFVIFDESLSKPLLVIELNDSSHGWNNRKARDEFVQNALESNGIKILNINLNDVNNKESLESRIRQLIM